MSARAAVMLVAVAGAAGAAWWVIGRERAARETLAQDNAPYLYAGGAGVDAAGEPIGNVVATVESAADAVIDFFDGVLLNVGLNVSARWLTVAQRAENQPYYEALLLAEQKYSIPSHLLVRLCYQESRYNPTAFNRASNATGIMQIVPRWHPGVDATDPIASIDYGAGYLRDMFRQFGTWELALQAYNWGPGNLKKYLAGELTRLPSETANYSRMILADIGAARGAVA